MKTSLLLTISLMVFFASAQEPGNAAYDRANNVYAENAVYGNNNYYKQINKTSGGNFNHFLPNDSIYTFVAKVMINVQPDSYLAVFGLSQEGSTVAECNQLINDRLTKFKAGLKNLGIKDEDLFVDLITQTRIYDYKITGKTATETKQGYELKKNIHIKFTNHEWLEKMTVLASEQEIYDIIKVDYIINEPEKIQTQLRQAAVEIIENKKKFVLANSSLSLSDKGLIQFENLNTVFPKNSYNQYIAAESAVVQPSYYNRDTWVKEQRKSKTFYFEKLNPASFDKVINPQVVNIPIQMSIDLGYKFYIGKPEKKTRK
ncbi:MAG: SIMPL domain-containing protein [Bacteroidota bacterium]|nr:SIMPL domain-containing protein [Bacteroidota bacterium]